LSLLQKWLAPMNFLATNRSFRDTMACANETTVERTGLMSNISHVWDHIQTCLFPFLSEELGPLTDAQRKLAAILETIRIEDFIPARWWWLGRPPKDRVALAKAFVAKMASNCANTRELIERLRSTPSLRRLCGWERAAEVPSESTFSRAFEEFAASELPARAHAALIKKYEGERLVGHLSRDATDLAAREKPAPKPVPAQPAAKAAPPKKRGRPKKGEPRPAKAPTRLERQLGMKPEEMLAELPTGCDWGAKHKNGKVWYWKGYKLHVDWADGEIPVSAILTSASVHDSQVAIPLAAMSAGRVVNLYDLMDAGYDVDLIRAYSRSLGHVPIIDASGRRVESVELGPAEKRRYDERTTAERGFSLYKEGFGGRQVRVRGYGKVWAHVMFGLLALTAERVLNLLL
jgi:hypothetical protein